MLILVITNLYPPQELGGYGRSIADFTWGLMKRGHYIKVITSNASYLGEGSDGPSGESVIRKLRLKGSYENGVSVITQNEQCKKIDQANKTIVARACQDENWDAILLGNLDLLGIEFLNILVDTNIPIFHHIGFVTPPYSSQQLPHQKNYRTIMASAAVKNNMISHEIGANNAGIIYPGARVDLFGLEATKRSLPPDPDGTKKCPLKVCFAGLLMSSKGPHTILEAVAIAKQRGVFIQAMIAGAGFDQNYIRQLKLYAKHHDIEEDILYAGNLTRDMLARFFRLNHACIFSSIYPEAFGIVAAEAMASGLALISSAVGGAAELFKNGETGIQFQAGNADDLSKKLQLLAKNPHLLKMIQRNGKQYAMKTFDMMTIAKQLEELIEENIAAMK